MRQHHEDDGRHCWRTARERNRMHARFKIRQRVAASENKNGILSSQRDHSSSSADDHVQTTTEKNDALLIRQILYHIVQGDRSFFSVQFMAEHAALLNRAISTSFLLQDNNDSNGQQPELYLKEKITSRWGQSVVEQLHDTARRLECFTFYEYAVWLTRYHVVAALLLGGMNPCCLPPSKKTSFNCSTKQAEVSKANKDNNKESLQTWRDEMLDVGNHALQQFFTGVVPLGLSSYIVKRVVDLRAAAAPLSLGLVLKNDNEGKEAITTRICPLCRRDIPCDVCLCTDNGCEHTFCEVCWWKFVLQRLSLWDDDADVVQCPVCHHAECGNSAGDTSRKTHEPWYMSLDPAKRAEVSRDRFCALPVDCKALKRRSGKKARIPECNAICSTWSAAVLPSLGSNQAVRRERFFGYVEKGSYFHVKGILLQGIDVSMVNEYGQTALFIAVWHGNFRLVRLLLDFGSDPMVESNGGISANSVAERHGYDSIVQLLHQSLHHHAQNNFGGMSLFAELQQHELKNRHTVTVLIDPSLSHPGAGSFVVDEAMSEHNVVKLIDLWRCLPVEETVKKKKGPCSVRSYFCDALGWICSQLEAVLTTVLNGDDSGDRLLDEGENVIVWPHMRFLCYEEPSTALVPHVDLCRVHPFRSQTRSTHTFILYLSDCDEGGETTLLKDLCSRGGADALAGVKPKRGRLLLFPHECPHQGEPVISVPKLLIRGEVRIRHICSW